MRQAEKERLEGLFVEAADLFRAATKRGKILSTLTWGREVAEQFFAAKCEQLPRPTYDIDRSGIEAEIAALENFGTRIAGRHPVLQWLDATRRSYLDALRLLLHVETDSFYDIVSSLYGNTSSRPFAGTATNLDLARAIGSRLGVCTYGPPPENERWDAETFAEKLREVLAVRRPQLEVRVEVSDQIAAKIAAGTTRVRVRKGATFAPMELFSLWSHEIEAHCLTAQNGLAQTKCPFLVSGGPRSTMTQEGLAVFSEVYGHSMVQDRFLRLCDRVEAVAQAEQGASFIDVYRWFLPRSHDRYDAFCSAQRIFRGAKIDGGKPFTKDVVYLSGLVGVFHFLQLSAKNQNRQLVEALVCGRLALEDVGVLAWLRDSGMVDPPKHIPEWLANWDGLVTFFSFMAILPQVDIDSYHQYFARSRRIDEWDLSL